MSEAVSCGSRKRPAAAVEPDSVKQQTAAGAIMLANDYSGYKPEPGIQHLSERIAPGISAEEFFNSFVVKRRPTVFEGSLVDKQWKGGDQWTLSYLSHKAGSATVTVEGQPTSDMGRMYHEMQYQDFVSLLTRGQTR